VVIDLQAAQSATYRERGVARYALDFTTAVAAGDARLVDQVLIRDDLPPVGRTERLVAAGVLTTTPEWGGGGVFHALSPFDLDVPLGRLWPRPAAAAGWKLVLTVYDLIPARFPETYLTDPGTRRRYQARQQLVRAADHVMTLSRTVADDVHERLGVPTDRITVVGAACGPQFTPPSDRAAEEPRVRSLVPGVGPRTIVYNGAVEPRKNMERLLEAFARVPAETRAGTQLVLVCRLSAPQRNHFEHEASRLGLAGQLLLTGEIPDEALIALYRTAELVVFPSLAEGYGLPVAEAMACGAPVVASARTAAAELVAPEATFDPWREEAIADALHRGLADAAFRARLAEWSARPQPGWADVAGKAAGVYRKVAGIRAGRLNGARQSPRTGRARRRVALVTPWPPSASGVAIYSARLVEHMAEQVDVDVFADGDAHPGERLGAGGVTVRPAASFGVVESAVGGYDAVIVCLGNSEFHSAGLGLLRRRRVEAVTLLHDVRLTELYRHAAARGVVPEGIPDAVAGMYGTAPSEVVEEGWVRPETADRFGLFMAREVIGLSRRVVVTSEFAARLARADAQAADHDRVYVVPHAYPDVIGPPAERDPGRLASFGVVNEVKRPLVLVEALATLRRGGRDVRLVLAGPASDHDRAAVTAAAARLGVADRVELTGFLEPAAYEELMGRVGLAVQLRARTNGEASGAVHDCVAHGVPTVVADLGSAGELPDLVEKVPAAVTGSQLAARLAGLLDDPVRRARMAEEGRSYARRHDFADAADQILALAGISALRRTG
jgi:glycosyltransferase involved in cell wall biosynthesis